MLFIISSQEIAIYSAKRKMIVLSQLLKIDNAYCKLATYAQKIKKLQTNSKPLFKAIVFVRSFFILVIYSSLPRYRSYGKRFQTLPSKCSSRKDAGVSLKIFLATSSSFSASSLS